MKKCYCWKCSDFFFLFWFNKTRKVGSCLRTSENDHILYPAHRGARCCGSHLQVTVQRGGVWVDLRGGGCVGFTRFYSDGAQSHETSQTQSPLKLHRAGLNPSKNTQYWNPGVWRNIHSRSFLSIDWIERSMLQFISFFFFLNYNESFFSWITTKHPPSNPRTTTVNRANSSINNFILSCTWALIPETSGL